MLKLSEIQSLLLATASQRTDGSLLPHPPTLSNVGARITKALAALVKHGLAGEREVGANNPIYREDGERRLGLFVTPAGLQAIGIEPAPAPIAKPVVPANAAPAERQPRATKAALVIGLLERTGGATLPELIEATGWLPHTTRAALTGLRKKGHAIERTKRADMTCYRIVAAA